MCSHFHHILLGTIFFCLTLPGVGVAGPVPDARDLTILEGAGVPTEGRGLLSYLQRFAGDDNDLTRLEKLATQLGSDSFDEREDASRRLARCGPTAISPLRLAAASADTEVVKRANTCIALIRKDWRPELHRAAIRRLADLQGDGAMETLLRLLPYAVDEAVETELWYGLDRLSKRTGQPGAAFVSAARDPVATRRAFAGYALGRRGDAAQKELARNLLKDPERIVRLRAAQGLLGAADKAGIPVLIELLGSISITTAWQAEELLHWAVGKSAPTLYVGSGSPAGQRACRDAWEKWWQGAHDAFTFTPATRGPMLLLLFDLPGHDRTRLSLCGSDGRTRWQLALPDAVDVQFLPAGRLLVATNQWGSPHLPPGCVTEMDLSGKPVWQYTKGMKLLQACHRGIDGTTFLCNGVTAVEVMPDQSEITVRRFGRKGLFEGLRPAYPFRLANGNWLYTREVNDHLSGAVEVNEAGKVLAEAVPDTDGRTNCPGHPSASGNYLFLLPREKKIAEYGRDGELVWAYSGAFQTATELFNGNVLLTRWNTPGTTELAEIDRAGKEVWSAEIRPTVPRLIPVCPLVALGFDAPDSP
jgi:hypothetical protein